jgi:hypothetical protein
MATVEKVRELSFAGLEHMSLDHFAAFGMIVTMTSHLDALLDQIIVAMTESANKPAFYPILTFLSAKDKRDYIEAMAGISRLGRHMPLTGSRGLWLARRRSSLSAITRHVRRSCDLSSLTNSAAHSRASGIFPASRKARAFARAWLSADRSAADSFPDRAPRAIRVSDDLLRIAAGPNGPTRFRRETNFDRRRFDRNSIRAQLARGRRY